jgi:hypothetical protein
MRTSQFCGLMVAIVELAGGGVAGAQAPVAPAPVAPAPVAPAPVAPAAPVAVAPAPVAAVPAAADYTSSVATGFMVQARMQAQSSLLQLGGGPGFLIGYRGPTYSLGVGLGLTRLGLSSQQSGSVSANATLLQILPTALIDVWHSADGRARANLIGGLGYERASATVTQDSQTCVFDTTSGMTICQPRNNKDSVGATLIPIMLGIGGDYFLSRNFALGAEGGFQAAFLTSVDEDSNGRSQSFDTTGDMEFAYGVIRATIVLGD